MIVLNEGAWVKGSRGDCGFCHLPTWVLSLLGVAKSHLPKEEVEALRGQETPLGSHSQSQLGQSSKPWSLSLWEWKPAPPTHISLSRAQPFCSLRLFPSAFSPLWGWGWGCIPYLDQSKPGPQGGSGEGTLAPNLHPLSGALTHACLLFPPV